LTAAFLTQQILKKRSFLCVGLDTDITKIPEHLLGFEDPVFEFNKAIIDATHPYTVAYKPNTAFYEALGIKGWRSLQKTIEYLNLYHPYIFTIADAKRGDIGNTSSMYAKAFFEDMAFDSVTVAPYMGKDSIEPFLAYQEKFTIVLALTSNEGASDFQVQPVGDGFLYQQVLTKSLTYNNAQNLMFVVGATKASYFTEIRKIVPTHFLLVPGIGAQGGSLEEVCLYGMSGNVGLLVNASRSVIYASQNADFNQAAAAEASAIAAQMGKMLDKYL
jgi:orotidine-5'-phosphate decarboxylase